MECGERPMSAAPESSSPYVVTPLADTAPGSPIACLSSTGKYSLVLTCPTVSSTDSEPFRRNPIPRRTPFATRPGLGLRCGGSSPRASDPLPPGQHPRTLAGQRLCGWRSRAWHLLCIDDRLRCAVAARLD